MKGDMGAAVSFKSQKDAVSTEEWETRLELAALYRLIDHYGFSSTTANHMTARVPGEPTHFLINPRGYLFSEICASSLVKIDIDGTILSDAPTGIVNPAGYNIHSAVMAARPDVNCAVHLHTVQGAAVSAQKDGLQFLCQESMRFYNSIGFHDYEGIARESDERERLGRDLGDNFALILRNHGSLIVGRTVAEAFSLTLNYETSCKVQVAAQAAGTSTVMPPVEVLEKTSNHRDRRNVPQGDDAWVAYRRLADFHYPSYAN